MTGIKLGELFNQPLEIIHPLPAPSCLTNTTHLFLLHLCSWLNSLHIHPLLANSSSSMSTSEVNTPLAFAVQHPFFLLRLYNRSLKTVPLP